MSSSDANATAQVRLRLIAHAEDTSTRIQVLDANLQPVADGMRLGDLELELPPGGYCVRFYQGDAYWQKIVVLEPEQPIQEVSMTDAEAPAFATSVPLVDKSTGEIQSLLARDLSLEAPQQPAHTKLGGAELLLFIHEPQSEERGDPSQGLTLHALDGELIFDFHAQGKRDATAGWAGAHLLLDPGAYRLRLQDRGGPVEQIVYCCKEWQTQLFLLTSDLGKGRGHIADLRSGSVIMARPGGGFDFNRTDLRQTETALRALSDRGNIPGRVRTEMLWTKFENPMLGIYAGLLHLRLQKIDPGLLREVVANLVRLVGPLPDVLALGWGLAVRDQTFREDGLFKASIDCPGDLATPPMLRASWDQLLEATTLRPDLVPRGSFSDRVAPQIVSGGPWLSWRGEVPAAPTEPTPMQIPVWLQAWGLTPSLVDDLAQGTLVVGLPMLSKLLEQRPDAADQLYSKRFTDLERRVAQYVYPLVDPQLRELAEASPRLREKLKASADKRSSDPAELVRSLKVPAGTALGAVWGLIRKLEIQPVLPAEAQLQAFVFTEAHDDPRLEGVLERIGETKTQLHQQRGGRAVNGLEFLYLCYLGSPAEFSFERPKAARLAKVLNEAEFVVGPEDKPVTGRTIGSILGELRKTTVQAAEPAVEAGELQPAPGWQEHVLPRPSRYREGELFAALKPSLSRELLPEL